MTWAQRRTVVIVLVVIAVIAVVWELPRWLFPAGVSVSSNSVLVMNLNGTIDEQRPADLASTLFGSRVLVLHQIVDSIDLARTDPRIRGLVLRIGPLDTGWAKLEEIHRHLIEFRSSHKPSICYLGYDGIGNPEYYLATGCEQVWLGATNTLGVQGMMAEALFLRGTLDKLRIVPDFYHIAEYKTATNMYTEKKFTPAHREEVQSLLRSVYDRYLTDVSEARGMKREQFASLVDEGPFLAQEALKDKLVDRVAYWDQVRKFFRGALGGWNAVNFMQYRRELSSGYGPRIAVIYASGEIVSGDSQSSPTGTDLMGGDTVASELRRARKDPTIRAIVLRVDSPGGSAVASEVIRREVQLAREEKPVVVSMSGVAASGGYWISMSANKIIAEPDSITASIGVLSGKLNLAGLYHLLGLSTDFVATSDNATLYSDQQNFTPAQEKIVQKMLEDVYRNFTSGVAQGRHLPLAEVDKIAKGRVWSGAEAKGLGLVDDLGGMDRAVAVAKNLAHLPASSSVQIVRMPAPKSLFDLLFARARDETSVPTSEYGLLQEMLHRLSVMVSVEPVRVQMPYLLTIR